MSLLNHTYKLLKPIKSIRSNTPLCTSVVGLERAHIYLWQTFVSCSYNSPSVILYILPSRVRFVYPAVDRGIYIIPHHRFSMMRSHLSIFNNSLGNGLSATVGNPPQAPPRRRANSMGTNPSPAQPPPTRNRQSSVVVAQLPRHSLFDTSSIVSVKSSLLSLFLYTHLVEQANYRLR